jgi:hypothetical protein
MCQTMSILSKSCNDWFSILILQLVWENLLKFPRMNFYLLKHFIQSKEKSA